MHLYYTNSRTITSNEEDLYAHARQEVSQVREIVLDQRTRRRIF